MADNPTFLARDLWAAAGTPYSEPDIVQVIAATVRTLIYAGSWRLAGGLFADAQLIEGSP